MIFCTRRPGFVLKVRPRPSPKLASARNLSVRSLHAYGLKIFPYPWLMFSQLVGGTHGMTPNGLVAALQVGSVRRLALVGLPLLFASHLVHALRPCSAQLTHLRLENCGAQGKGQPRNMTANCCADSDKSVAKAQGEVKEEARLPDCTGRFFRFVMSGRLPLLRMLHIRHVQDGAEDSLVETEQDHQPEGSEGKDPCCFTLSGMARACPRLEVRCCWNA